jgi:hypothetical protein
MSRSQLNHMFKIALHTHHEDTYDEVRLGLLQGFEFLFSPEYKSNLNRLSLLESISRADDTTDRKLPRLKVIMGVGLQHEAKLYDFFNAVLQFQSREHFSAFLQNGYSLQIVVGIEAEIVGAITFIVAEDGMFIDALGVSNGHGPHCCNLGSTTFKERNKPEKQFFARSNNGGFQGLGVGSFLLTLAADFATFKCKKNVGATITLKTSTSAFPFYEKYGFNHVEPPPPLPTVLEELVPLWNTDLTDESTWWVSQTVEHSVERIRGLDELPESSPSPETIADTSQVRSVQPAAKVAYAKLLKKRQKILDAFNSAGGNLEPGRSDGRGEAVGGSDAVARAPPGQAESTPGGEVNPPLDQKSKKKSSTEADRKPAGKKKATSTSKVDPSSSRKSPRRRSGKRDSDSSDSDLSDAEAKTDPARELTYGLRTPPKADSKKEAARKRKLAEKKAANKRAKIESTRREKMETCAIEASDKSDFEYDYDNYNEVNLPTERWILPVKDFWEPQDERNKDLRVRQGHKPVQSHGLTQNEIYARYPRQGKPLPFGRIKVLRQALMYKTNTEILHKAGHKRYHMQFREQDYVDFACAADKNRPVALAYETFKRDEQLISINVASYRMPNMAKKRKHGIPDNGKITFLMNNRTERRALEREVRTIEVDLRWLRSTCREEMVNKIDELVLGSNVMRVNGQNIATEDAISLSFTGKLERVKGFLALPQGQKIVEYKVKQPKAPDKTKPDKREIWYDLQHHVTDTLRNLQKAEHIALNLPYAPPPPCNDTQIVKLKWLPSKNKEHRGDQGIWHGLFAVAMGVAKPAATLQECSLTDDWVKSAFSSAFLRECKAIVTGPTTKRNETKYLYIPAGDARDPDADEPPSEELLTEVSVKYQQGLGNTCLRHSMSSAFHAMGFTENAMKLALETSISGVNVTLVDRAALFVRKQFKDTNLIMKRVFDTACSVDQVTQEDQAWPMLLIIQTSDGIYGSHAITTWNGMIFDSNCPHALRWSQRSLDWCSGKTSECIGFSRVYRLCPEFFGKMSPGSSIRIGTQIRTPDGAFGWVRRLPTFKKNGEQKKGYIVCYTDGSTETFSPSDILSYELKK